MELKAKDALDALRDFSALRQEVSKGARFTEFSF